MSGRFRSAHALDPSADLAYAGSADGWGSHLRVGIAAVLVENERGTYMSAAQRENSMRRYLVVANQTLSSNQLQQELLMRAEAGESLFHFLVPDTPERDYAEAWSARLAEYEPGTVGALTRLKDALNLVRDAGACALGAIGNPDPIEAVELQMQCSAYDEVIVSMLPELSSKWFTLDIPSRIARSISTPVTTLTAKDM